MKELISYNGVSKVYKEDGYIYKRQPKFLTDNEIWCLKKLYPYGFVPYAEQVELELIRMQYIPSMPVINKKLLEKQAAYILESLKDVGIRHGDLTEKNLIIYKAKLYIIDFAESRLTTDPRTDKRPEGDSFWLYKTIGGFYE